MWKSIVLCVSLFGGAALGLAVGARYVEAAALPAAAAIGLCVIGVVLILAAPANDALPEETSTTTSAAVTTEPALDIEPAPLVSAAPSVSNRTPSVPFQALQT